MTGISLGNCLGFGIDKRCMNRPEPNIAIRIWVICVFATIYGIIDHAVFVFCEEKRQVVILLTLLPLLVFLKFVKGNHYLSDSLHFHIDLVFVFDEEMIVFRKNATELGIFHIVIIIASVFVDNSVHCLGLFACVRSVVLVLVRYYKYRNQFL